MTNPSVTGSSQEDRRPRECDSPLLPLAAVIHLVADLYWEQDDRGRFTVCRSFTDGAPVPAEGFAALLRSHPPHDEESASEGGIYHQSEVGRHRSLQSDVRTATRTDSLSKSGPKKVRARSRKTLVTSKPLAISSVPTCVRTSCMMIIPGCT